MKKIMIASDIHGSAYYCRQLLERYKEEKAEKARNQEQESWKTNRKNFIYLQLHVNNIKWNKILIVYIL